MSSSENSDNGSLTEGELVGPMFKLAWPLVVIQLLQVAYNVGDTIWLGALSGDAVGAVSLAFPLLFLLIAVGSGFTTAGAILIAQHTGAESGKGGLIAGQTLSFISLVAIGLGILGYFLTVPMLEALPADPQTDEAIIPLAADYLQIFFLGLPFVFGFFVFVALMRGYGNTRAPMRVMFISVIINLAIDPLLIFGVGPLPRLEVAGAAVATVISRGVATAIGFYLLYYTDVGPEIEAAHIRPRLEYVREITRLGVPTALEQSMTAMALVAMTAIVVTFPPEVVAAYGLGNRLVSLAFLPALGMGQATDSIVGQNLGAGMADRAERAVGIAAGVVGSIMFVSALVAFLFPEPFVSVFLLAEEEGRATIIDYGVTYLQFSAVAFVFMGVMQVVQGAFRGAGNTKTALAFAVFGLWLVRVPVTYYLAFVAGWGPTGIWAGVVTGDIVGAIAATAWFTRGTWKESIVDDSDEDTGDDSGKDNGDDPDDDDDDDGNDDVDEGMDVEKSEDTDAPEPPVADGNEGKREPTLD
ncbi:MATE efflux family protein [Natrialba magadii ATCC 43099]|uniref:MATE efflux family protein n=1 Tax=Natrialba magadii (strain ATCC 43099 / DSM 3394 / CCM 3739 / CIP 104546 / IAM 13178 / JCM 8861 / NBRC 102185 / NCIMB 2190 / MS3) TaxID=547559 RepID=D3SYV8_NATMM|nr:MATE family efflux transporter [Natrialba magadii]ADD06150.1 MATE efflux family protein [Natrialba magadii ATCC 43099]ELY30851.1 MATE efflux family protein [Natrialba magadii ATCC 43099]